MKTLIEDRDVEQHPLLRDRKSEHDTPVKNKKLLTAIFSVGVCMAWMFVSSSAILVNRHIMVGIGFKYPITLAWMGLATTMVFTNLHSLTLPPSKRAPFDKKNFIKTSLPTGLFMALSFQLGNTGYMYLTVSFVQMLKALCPVITMAILALTRLERFSKPLVVSVMAITLGIALASYGELNRSFTGVIAMLMSVISESIRLVLIQYILVGSQFPPMEGLKLVSTACAFWLALQAGFLEIPSILAENKFQLLVSNPMATLFGCISGFGVNLTAILVIAYCSSLTLKVVGTFKDVLLVGYGILVFHEHVSSLQLLGYGVAILGFSSYNYLKATTPVNTSSSSTKK